jgi:hypothetical protein
MASISNEKELEDYLFSQPESPIGCYGKCFRQFEIKGYGIVDLLYVDIDYNGKVRPLIQIKIIELKKDKIDFNALGQISRYKIALERYFNNSTHYFNYDIEGILVGSKYASGDICFTIDSTEWLSCYLYEVNLLEGITFECSEGWFNKGEDLTRLDKTSKELFNEYIQKYKEYTRVERSKR